MGHLNRVGIRIKEFVLDIKGAYIGVFFSFFKILMVLFFIVKYLLNINLHRQISFVV